MKKILFPAVILIIIIVAGIAIYSSTKGEEKNGSQQESAESQQATDNQGNDSNTEESTRVDGAIAILFYGYTCPHCKTLNDWLETNNIKDKVKFDHLEIYKDRDNNALLTEKAKSCDLDEDLIGVPFLYDIENNKCMSGSDKIIDFFESKI